MLGSLSTYYREGNMRKRWNRLLGGISVWAILASVSGAGASAVNIQYKHNTAQI